MNDNNHTTEFNFNIENVNEVKELIKTVYSALEEKGYNPVSQMTGYILSGDPTYITSYNNARSLVMKIERDELVDEILSYYIKSLKEE